MKLIDDEKIFRCSYFEKILWCCKKFSLSENLYLRFRQLVCLPKPCLTCLLTSRYDVSLETSKITKTLSQTDFQILNLPSIDTWFSAQSKTQDHNDNP